MKLGFEKFFFTYVGFMYRVSITSNTIARAHLGILQWNLRLQTMILPVLLSIQLALIQLKEQN